MNLKYWDIGPRGHMTNQGQQYFPTYNDDGGLGSFFATYRLVGNEILETFVSVKQPALTYLNRRVHVFEWTGASNS